MNDLIVQDLQVFIIFNVGYIEKGFYIWMELKVTFLMSMVLFYLVCLFSLKGGTVRTSASDDIAILAPLAFFINRSRKHFRKMFIEIKNT